MKSTAGKNNNLHEMLLEEFDELELEFRAAADRLESETEKQILEVLDRYAEITPEARSYFTGRYAYKRTYKDFREQFGEFGRFLHDPSAWADAKE